MPNGVNFCEMILPYANSFVGLDISGGGSGDGGNSGWQMIEPKENTHKCITKLNFFDKNERHMQLYAEFSSRLKHDSKEFAKAKKHKYSHTNIHTSIHTSQGKQNKSIYVKKGIATTRTRKLKRKLR